MTVFVNIESLLLGQGFHKTAITAVREAYLDSQRYAKAAFNCDVVCPYGDYFRLTANTQDVLLVSLLSVRNRLKERLDAVIARMPPHILVASNFKAVPAESFLHAMQGTCAEAVFESLPAYVAPRAPQPKPKDYGAFL